MPYGLFDINPKFFGKLAVFRSVTLYFTHLLLIILSLLQTKLVMPFKMERDIISTNKYQDIKPNKLQ